MDALTIETDPRVGELRSRLDAFYATTKNYNAFTKAVNHKPEFWTKFLPGMGDVIARKGLCRVLEFGAGRTGFGDYLKSLDVRTNVDFTAQDITPQNVDHLRTQADAVHIGDVLDIKDRFDVIFSTFVWEHVSNPREVLQHLLGLLEPGGSLFIACPRYDNPLYIPPSARHYGLVKRLAVARWLATKRWFSRSPQFAIHVDPAVLNGPWYRDADAIHWVSMADFQRAIPKGYSFHAEHVNTRGWRLWIWRKFMLAFVRITRDM